MPEIPFKLQKEFVSVIGEMSMRVAELFGNKLAISADLPKDDPELAEAWHDSLIETLHQDIRCLVHFIEDERFGQEPIWLEDSVAEGVLKACSAIRIKIRELYLQKLTDSEIEEGEFSEKRLDAQGKRAYLTYTSLAMLQGIVINCIEGVTSSEAA